MTINNWSVAKNGEKTETAHGLVWLRGPQGSKATIHAEGQVIHRVFPASGQIRTKVIGSAFVVLSEDGEVFRPFRTVCVKQPEVFTNMDRQPQESGSVLEVTKALRMLELRQMAIRRENREYADTIRREREAFMAERDAPAEQLEIEDGKPSEDVETDQVAQKPAKARTKAKAE